MKLWGKIIGGVLGFITLGGPIGMILGLFFGHMFDKGLNQDFTPLSRDEQAQIQARFFSATFSFMGRLAKIDGHVSQQEINAAEQVMAHLGLSNQMRSQAIEYFNRGKSESFDWQGEIDLFAQATAKQPAVRQMFMEILIQSGFADGQLKHQERALLGDVATKLGFSSFMLERLILMVKAQQSFHQQRQHRGHAGTSSRVSTAAELQQAYQLLGVSENASMAEVKKAYRKQMAQHHPDKLVAKGLPEEMIKVATEKTQEIKAAYELIADAKKSK